MICLFCFHIFQFHLLLGLSTVSVHLVLNHRRGHQKGSRADHKVGFHRADQVHVDQDHGPDLGHGGLNKKQSHDHGSGEEISLGLKQGDVSQEALDQKSVCFLIF